MKPKKLFIVALLVACLFLTGGWPAVLGTVLGTISGYVFVSIRENRWL